MKKGKKLLILLAVMLLLVLGVIILKNVDFEDEEDDSTQETVIYSISSNTSAVSWDYMGETVTLDIEEDGWKNRDDESVSLNSVNTDAMQLAIQDVTASRTIENPEDLAEFGLDEPALTVRVTTGDEVTTFSIGDVSSISGERYVSIGDGNVYLVSSSIYNAFAYTADEIVAEEEEGTE